MEAWLVLGGLLLAATAMARPQAKPATGPAGPQRPTGASLRLEVLLDELASNVREGRLALRPVTMEAALFDSRPASVALRWRTYRGPRFAEYRVERLVEGAKDLLVHASTSLNDTAGPLATLELARRQPEHRGLLVSFAGPQFVAVEDEEGLHRGVAGPVVAVREGVVGD